MAKHHHEPKKADDKDVFSALPDDVSVAPIPEPKPVPPASDLVHRGPAPKSEPIPNAVGEALVVPLAAPAKLKGRTARVGFGGCSVPPCDVEVPTGTPSDLVNKTAIDLACAKLGIWSAPVGPTVEWLD